MQNFITIFFTVLEIGSFSLFQNLELGKASTDKKFVSSQFLWLDVVNINFTQTFIKIFHSVQAIEPFLLRPMINVLLQFLELDLVNINVSAKFY